MPERAFILGQRAMPARVRWLGHPRGRRRRLRGLSPGRAGRACGSGTSVATFVPAADGLSVAGFAAVVGCGGDGLSVDGAFPTTGACALDGGGGACGVAAGAAGVVVGVVGCGAGGVCGNSFAINADGRGSGNPTRRAPGDGSSAFGTRIAKRMLFLSLPATRAASGPAPK